MTNTTTNVTKKVTKRECYNRLIEVLTASQVDDKQELVNFINHELELLDRKKNSFSSPNPNSKAGKDAAKNQEFKKHLLEILANAEDGLTCGEIIQLIDENFKEFVSTSKVSAMLKQLGESGTGQVVRYIEKRQAKFKLV